MTAPTQPHIASDTPGYAKRRARALIGWLPAAEGAHWLGGRQLAQEPSSAHLALCEAARESVANRPVGVDQSDLFSDLPAEVQAHIAVLLQNTRSAQVLAESGTPRLVDLSRVCAAQPQIHVEDARRRVEDVHATDPLSIARITLPLASDEKLPVAFDQTKNAWILSSPNPNLRVVGHFTGDVGGGVPGFGFVVMLQQSYLQVAGLGGRYFLRDGYHRAYGLLAAGVRYAPALVRDFASFEEVGLPPGLLPQAAYLGDRPPLLSDYLDDAVSADTQIPLTQKMIVVQALELNSIG